MGYHALLSPSSGYMWSSCTMAIRAQSGRPDSTNPASRMGTCGHQINAEVLGEGADLDSFLGREMWFLDREEYWAEDWPHKGQPEFIHKVDQTLLDACEWCCEYVWERVRLTGGHLEVEQRVPIGHFTGEPGAGGTADVVLIYGDTIETIDHKLGRHKVEAFDILSPARGTTPPVKRMNLQLAFYCLGAMHKFDWLADFKHAKATILQPFLNHVSEHSCTVDELLDIQEFLRVKANETRENPQYAPGYKTCHWCKASGDCEAQTNFIKSQAANGFGDADVSRLGDLYDLIPMVQDWCKAVGERVWRELDAGRPVTRADGLSYIFVTGKMGNRQWKDEAAAEQMLKHFRLRNDEMYVSKVISPAVAEKLAKVKKKNPTPPVINKSQWDKLQTLITQAPAGKSIALETDTREALPMPVSGFADVAEDCSDLF